MPVDYQSILDELLHGISVFGLDTSAARAAELSAETLSERSDSPEIRAMIDRFRSVAALFRQTGSYVPADECRKALGLDEPRE